MGRVGGGEGGCFLARTEDCRGELPHFMYYMKIKREETDVPTLGDTSYMAMSVIGDVAHVVRCTSWFGLSLTSFPRFPELCLLELHDLILVLALFSGAIGVGAL